MAKCSYCNSTIILGGIRDGDLRFCNDKCQQDGALLRVSQLISVDEVMKRVFALHQGPCPSCQGSGPVDVHTSHAIWSALVLTTWKSVPRLSCTPCGQKAKLKATVSSFLLGWWGLPWGLLGTPVQITKNIYGLIRPPSPFMATPQLEKIIRLTMAEELRQQERSGALSPVIGRN